MTAAHLRLRAHEVWSALEVIDPVAVLAEDLVGRTIGRAHSAQHTQGCLLPWGESGRNGTELVVLHPSGSGPCVVPAQCLRDAQSAALAALAARELLVGGAATVAMLGPVQSAQAMLAIIARHVPDISHIALHFVDGQQPVEPKLVDQLELSGIRLSVAPTVADAVFGANLVVATNNGPAEHDLDMLRLDQLARGAVLVNATGRDLAAALVDNVDQLFVDDFMLLDEHLERRAVATHLAKPTIDSVNLHGGTGPRIAADLAQLLTGRHAGRRRGDDVLLVEFLGAHELNAELAHRICESAKRTGLGVRITD